MKYWQRFSHFLQHNQAVATKSDATTSASIQQALLRSTLEILPKPFFLVDFTHHKISYSNPAARRMMGLEYEACALPDIYLKKIALYSLNGEIISAQNLPSMRILRGEKSNGEEFILTSPAGQFHIKVFSEIIKSPEHKTDLGLIFFQDITELKKTETDLIRTQHDLNDAVEIAQVGFWSLDIKTQAVDVSPIFLKQFGIQPENFNYTLAAVFEAVHPSDREHVNDAINKSILLSIPYQIEYRVIHNDGSIHWIEAKGGHAVDNSKSERFTGTTHEITVRVLSRNALIENERNLQTLADTMPQIVWSAKPNGELDYFNQVWFDYSGSTFEDNVGTRWNQFVHPDDLGIIAERWMVSVASNVTYENEFRLLSKSGEYRWHVARAHPIFENNKVKKWYGTNTDIHEHRTLTDKLHAAQDRLELAMQSAGVGLWHINLASNHLTSSTNTAELVGLDEGLDQDAFSFLKTHLHPEDRERATNTLQTAINTKTDYFDEYRTLNTDGTLRWLQVVGRGRYTTKSSSLTGLVRDITHDKLRNEELDEARKTAERASLTKSQFLANMSHEIRTPLGAIMGFSELLRDDVRREDREYYISVIDRNSTQLLRIIDDILDLSKVEAGMMIVEHINFSLPEMITDFSSLMGFKAREKGVVFKSKALTPLPTLINTDPNRLRQILMNIVGNAVKFTEHGSVELRISCEGETLSFDVEDTGRGISKEQAEYLFQPFTQADASTTRKYGGTGLGLVLTRSLAQALGGEFILKRSELGQGSVFTVKINIAIPPNIEFISGLGFSTLPVRSIENLAQLGGLRILLVEDSPDNQELISIFLGRVGARIDIASDGQQGYAMAKKENYDVVLMDVQMPIMDGIAAVKALRKDGYTKPVIALTAHAMKEERKRCLDAGFTSFLSKPINREELIKTLASFKPQTGPLGY